MPSPAGSSKAPPSQYARPPTKEEIAAFMLRHTAHLPLVLHAEDRRQGGENDSASSVDNRHTDSARWVAPYLYTGADYALVLAACFPSHCIDLSLLNWSTNPLLSQRQGNLRVFCQAARALALPDAPLSALHPELLQSSASCIVGHLKVQHWLYSLSLRFMPANNHDAATLRSVHRHLQSGEPYLKRRRGEHDEDGVCASVRDCPPLPAEHLLRCAPALTPIPSFTDATALAQLSSAAAVSAEGANLKVGAEKSIALASHSADDAAEFAKKQKPWLNYSKPWLLPSLRAAEAKKAASEAAAAKRAQEERERNSRYTAYVAQAKNVHDQYVVSCTAAAEKRDQLRAIKTLLLQDIMEGKPVDFKDYAARLRECHEG
ncbi:hypothetical protein conserved [Leishmania donovani]|uniref:Uncharacterized protein n=3 Tax=Leishmania donovani species complex TaxID=38574 RepID=A4I8U0_LEIIN|nr:conserved hypothetical protein [Leishmania infantum JPCM5]XP_003863903.1 hypothetical protein, conserved [Leishmania donovani]CAC9530636.1 hypothetical_protein_-_conserved [Leishmania infantum]AYU82047.1 hypothetical protein LdCL_330013400 [Leishmania donovani]TPP53789.1 hypothetical protein CGC21_38200 [Leishmania donovani]TPP55612.1 hypothetical protein CGC20_11030 [Leishmania donovani]CAJ1992043.1 hypothetical protein conserved [Leishmania donovani]|eukprot:XP_001468159.1 conserved hypothetical protein [Leishmania infantum JPCM5]